MRERTRERSTGKRDKSGSMPRRRRDQAGEAKASTNPGETRRVVPLYTSYAERWQAEDGSLHRKRREALKRCKTREPVLVSVGDKITVEAA